LFEVFLSVVITGENVKVVTVDLDISSESEISGSDELIAVVNILVLSTFKEFAFDNT